MTLPKKKRSDFNNLAAFTLIELVTAIAVIGIMAGIILVAINSSQVQAKGRDVKRKSDLEAVRAALELYAVSQVDRKYPHDAAGTCYTTYASLATPLAPYLGGSLPKDPKDGSDYTYSVNATGVSCTGFCLSDTLEASGAGTYQIKGGKGC